MSEATIKSDRGELRRFANWDTAIIILTVAVLLIASGDAALSAEIIDDVQARRPEWFAVWVARAALQSARKQPAEARQSLETAAALGARNSEVNDLPMALLSRPPREW